jgi:hypothetical protein
MRSPQFVRRLPVGFLVLSGLLVASARAQCPGWDEAMRLSGFDGIVRDTAVYDDGSGPVIYAVGTFERASGLPCLSIARWDGSHWNALPALSGAPTGGLYAAHVWDDGSGPALWVGGAGQLAGFIGRFDGSSWWSPPLGPNSAVFALEDYGGSLYAGGSFTQIGGQFQPGLARWNGNVWGGVSGMLGGAQAPVYALCVHDDGSGPALFAGGDFLYAGGLFAPNLARWDGTSWSAAPSGFDGAVRALCELPSGGGLVAGGSFTHVNGHAAAGVARWDGTSWSAFGAGISGGPAHVHALLACDDPALGGPCLYAGGEFTTAGSTSAGNVARWDGAAWNAAGIGTAGGNSITSGAVHELAIRDDGGGARVWAMGNFMLADGVVARRAARGDGQHWEPIEPNGCVESGRVYDLLAWDDGNGESLFAAGSFPAVGGAVASSIARFDGTTWSSLGTGGTPQIVALGVYDDGGGEQLFASGAATIGGVSGGPLRLARWNGAQWSTVPTTGVGWLSSGGIRCMTVFDDGNGPALYVGGHMSAVGQPFLGVARFKDGVWSVVGSQHQMDVQDLCVHDDGSGAALYAAGSLFIEATSGHSILARFDGTSWTAVGGVIPVPLVGGIVQTIVSGDDGRGPALWAGGRFSVVGGPLQTSVARFANGAWTAPAGGPGFFVTALAFHDEGSGRGPALYAGGTFTLTTDPVGDRLARWDGVAWSDLGGDVSDGWPIGPQHVEVTSLASWRGSHGSDLFVGGWFNAAGTTPSRGIARWKGCDETGRTFCYGDGSGAACPCGNSSAVGDRAGCLHSLGTGGTVRASGEPSLSDDTLVLNGASMTNSAVLYFQGMSAIANGAGAAFGDGLRCLTGPIIRMSTKINVGGASTYPTGIDVALSVRGAVFTPGKRTYQARFRNPAAFCTPDTFNYTNAIEILWTH